MRGCEVNFWEELRLWQTACVTAGAACVTPGAACWVTMREVTADGASVTPCSVARREVVADGVCVTACWREDV